MADRPHRPTGWLSAGLTYTGSVIGAGFASGQELWQFFGRHGLGGLAGLTVATAGFAVVGYLTLEAGRRGDDWPALLGRLYPSAAWPSLEAAAAAFLFLGLTVVAAGGDATLATLFGWAPPWGGLATVTALAATVAAGLGAVQRANALLIPALLMLMAWVAAHTGLHAPPAPAPPTAWLPPALLYFSYNLFTAQPVLLPLGAALPGRAQSARAAGLGALLLGATAALLLLAMHRLPQVGELPLLELAQRHSPLAARLYGLGLWVALYTTGVAQAYALWRRHRGATLLLLGAAAAVSRLGFQNLVATLYPVMGALAIAYWLPALLPPRRAVGR